MSEERTVPPRTVPPPSTPGARIHSLIDLGMKSIIVVAEGESATEVALAVIQAKVRDAPTVEQLGRDVAARIRATRNPLGEPQVGVAELAARRIIGPAGDDE